MRARPLITSVVAVGLCMSAGALAQTTVETETKIGTGEGQSASGEQQQGQSGAVEQQPSEASESGTSEQPAEAARAERSGAESGIPLNRLSRDQIQSIQRQLQERALYFGKIDGIAGPKTKAALKNYQAQQGLQASASITPESAESLGLSWEEVQRQPVSGMEGAEVQPGVGKSAQGADLGTNLSNLESEHVQKLQQKLQELGFYNGKVDGIAGPLTKSALQRFFREQAQLASRGKISDTALGAFDIEGGELQPTRGVEQEEQQRQPGAVEESEPMPEPRPQRQEPPPLPGEELEEAPSQPIPERMEEREPSEGSGQEY